MQKLANFINGQFVEPKNGKYLDNYDPATGQVYSLLPDSDDLDVVAAVQAANQAFQKWSKTTVEERSALLMKIADLIDQKADELARAESRDVGKPLSLARELDIPRAAKNFRYFAGHMLHRHEMATDMNGDAINYTVRDPLGVAGLISPWNLPLYLLTWKIAPALITGNTAVCKPSEITPMTAYLLAQIMQEAGLPAGVCNIVFGKGDTAGAALCRHPAVPIISFTGGTATGEKILQMTAPFFKKTSLELGGKNATIVLKDADLKKAVAGVVRSSFLNSGQICLCGSRIFVQQEVYDSFLSEFKTATENLTVGDPQDGATFMGPLVSRQHFDKVKSSIDFAISEKAKLITGGIAPAQLPAQLAQGYFLRPTILSDLDNCSELHHREIFGPVVTIQSFKYAHEAVKWANVTPYGLSASLWTQNVSMAHKLARDLQAGTVWVNTWLKRDLRMPFGGTKASGLGREGGDHSIDFFTEVKTVCVQL